MLRNLLDLFDLLHRLFTKLRYAALWIFCAITDVWADNNPFPTIDTQAGGDVVKAAGTTMETALKYALIGGGGLMILICIGILVHRLREDSREKDHGNLLMTFILLALGLTLGFVLIGIGWTAFSAQIQS